MNNYEERIIDTILNVIKDNQVYLTKSENLPQLAKLGYMYNTLWYAGRIASYEGTIPKKVSVDEDELDENGDPVSYECDQCDDNPKYKIEMCNPENEEIEDYIYDAWGMHVSNEYGPSWETFSKIVLEGKELSDIELKMMKHNKTFDEWVEILTDENYGYSSIYPNRKSVANHMLCVIGNGYDYKGGAVFTKASGAGQDDTDYGDWKNAKFREDIQAVVDVIMNDPEAKLAVHTTENLKIKSDAKKNEDDIKHFGMPYKDFLKSDVYNELKGIVPQKYTSYYPICNYSIISKLNADSDPSYIKAGVEICEDIIANEEEENKSQHHSGVNVKFAKKFLKKVQTNWGFKK